MQVAATKANEVAQGLKKAAAKSKQEEMHLFAKTPSEESLIGRIKSWGDKIKKLAVRGCCCTCFFVVGERSPTVRLRITVFKQ